MTRRSTVIIFDGMLIEPPLEIVYSIEGSKCDDYSLGSLYGPDECALRGVLYGAGLDSVDPPNIPQANAPLLSGSYLPIAVFTAMNPIEFPGFSATRRRMYFGSL